MSLNDMITKLIDSLKSARYPASETGKCTIVIGDECHRIGGVANNLNTTGPETLIEKLATQYKDLAIVVFVLPRDLVSVTQPNDVLPFSGKTAVCDNVDDGPNYFWAS